MTTSVRRSSAAKDSFPGVHRQEPVSNPAGFFFFVVGQIFNLRADL